MTILAEANERVGEVLERQRDAPLCQRLVPGRPEASCRLANEWRWDSESGARRQVAIVLYAAALPGGGRYAARPMARRDERLPENAPGDFFVDARCIDCDLCRQLAPDAFARDDRRGQSYVARQPADEAARGRALRALVTCPTASIGGPRGAGARAASRAFPERVEAEVGFCGYASADSYGASSWFVERPAGNVLVDSPRCARPLADALAARGGVRWMFLSHRDDAADHRAFRDRFGCERVLHRDDVGPDTRDVERVLEGPGPWRLDDDLLVIAVPGHTRGSCALLYRDAFLFSGDHLWASDDGRGLAAGRDVCWWSWDAQRRSVAKLADHRFAWVLPGHGRRHHADPDAMRAEVLRLAAAM